MRAENLEREMNEKEKRAEQERIRKAAEDE